MGNTVSSIVGAVGSWVGGIVAHLVALTLAPLFNQVRPQPPPLDARVNDLIVAVNGLSTRVERLTALLDTRQDPAVVEVAMRVVVPPPSPRRRPP